MRSSYYLIPAVAAVFILLKTFGVDLSYAQLFIFPALLFAFHIYCPEPVKFSRSTLAIIFLLGTTGVALSFNIEKFKNGGVAISRFIDDPLENESRIFRTRLNDLLSSLGNSPVVRYPAPIENISQAKVILDKEGRDAIAWGKTKQIALLIRNQPNQKLGDILGGELSKLGLPEISSFYLARSPRYLSLALGPKMPSDVFLSYFISGLIESDQSQKEVLLLSAGRILGSWRLLGHRAYTFWLLGTNYLLEGIDNGEFEPAVLDCSEKMLRRASALLSDPLANPELHSAIFNNHALVLYLQSKLENKPELQKHYQNEFVRAKLKYKRSEAEDPTIESSAWMSAQANLDLLYQLGEWESEKKERKALKAQGLIKKKHKSIHQ